MLTKTSSDKWAPNNRIIRNNDAEKLKENEKANFLERFYRDTVFAITWHSKVLDSRQQEIDMDLDKIWIEVTAIRNLILKGDFNKEEWETYIRNLEAYMIAAGTLKAGRDTIFCASKSRSKCRIMLENIKNELKTSLKKNSQNLERDDNQLKREIDFFCGELEGAIYNLSNSQEKRSQYLDRFATIKFNETRYNEFKLFIEII